jgi:hypothetical protein
MTRLQYTAVKTANYCHLYGGKDRRAHPTSGSGLYGVQGSGRRADLRMPPSEVRSQATSTITSETGPSPALAGTEG